MAEILNLKSIKEVIFEDENKESEKVRNFFIPSYQRGYRWDEQQVIDLLDDVYDFFQSKRSKDEFYCLQPIVVRFDDKNNYYKVIDGQQRLTTIYIILKYLQESSKQFKKIRDKMKNNDEYNEIFEYCDMEDFEVTEPYNIEYETRKDKEEYNSKDFLENKIIENEDYYNNPDFYHMSIAYKTIKKWFKNKPKKQFYETLLNDTKIIWYEVECNDEKEEIEIFTRLNIGKIQLTNAELIKAKLLIPVEDYKSQIEFSAVWDNMEQTLQKDDFWYFLTNKKKSQTAIDLIFDVLAQKYKQDYNKNKENKDDDKISYDENIEKFSYYIFEYVLKHNYKTEEQIWKDTNELFRVFLDWYDDRKIYHRVGYLIYFKYNLLSLYKKYESKTKDDFIKELDNLIRKDIQNINLMKFNFGAKGIKKVLLLFNIKTILQNKNSNARFDFFNLKFKKEKDGIKPRSWDIEHIASQTDNENKKEWIKTVYKYIGNRNISDEKLNFLEKRYERFYSLVKRLLNISELDESIKDNIGNLTLLDSKTNRSYGNTFFPIKRAIIIDEDSKGNFIPIATKNVFLKQYSKKLSDMMNWNEGDVKNYKKEIYEQLKDYGIKLDEEDNYE